MSWILVNMVSAGKGNYGKSPIFYSMTQCRDDPVRLLVELGTNLLVVNNKGQTPCSMAPSHLLPETCSYLYEVEAKQLAEGGNFVNYRVIHSDERSYGDLDPRFPIDEDNMGPDIVHEIAAYRHSFWLVNGDEPSEITNGLGFPRSLRQTTKEPRQARGLEYRANMTTAKITHDQLAEQTSGSTSTETSHLSSRRKRKVNHRQEQIVDVSDLEDLKLTEVLDGDGYAVNDERGVQELSRYIEEYLVSSTVNASAVKRYPSDEQIAQYCWGLDCEWKPAWEKRTDNPVATLQLGNRDRAFLVDLQELCQPAVKTSYLEMTSIECKLSDALTKLFAHGNTTIAGFGIGQDLSKLAMSFPHLPCFRLFESVIDVQMLSRSAFPGTRKDYVNSLQKAAAVLMQKRLDKTEQLSDWKQRPLSPSQIEYAILDAVLSCCLLSMMVKKISELDCWEGYFFKKHSHLRQTVRIQYLDCPEHKDSIPAAYRVSMGTVKQVLSIRFAKQTWPSGKATPPIPIRIPLEGAQRRDEMGNSIAKPTQVLKPALFLVHP